MFSLLPMPLEDEHILPLVSSALCLNDCHAKDYFGQNWRQLFRNQSNTIFYRKAAEFFKACVPQEEFLERHTYIRLYKPFLSQALYKRFLRFSGRDLAASYREDSHLFFSTDTYRFCPLCRSEDIANRQYARWRRTPQVSIVTVCSVHECHLVVECSCCGYVPGDLLSPDSSSDSCLSCGHLYEVSYPPVEHRATSILIAKFVYAVLDGRVSTHDPKRFVDIVIAKAKERFGCSERAVPARIRRQIECHFPAQLLEQINLHPRDGISAGWIRWFFARQEYPQKLLAVALIGAVTFRSLEEWLDAYGAIGTQAFAPSEPSCPGTFPLSAHLLKELAWHSELRIVAKDIDSRRLRWALANMPGLIGVRESRFIKAKAALVPEKHRLMRRIMKTNSKYRIGFALHRAEKNTPENRRSVVAETLAVARAAT